MSELRRDDGARLLLEGARALEIVLAQEAIEPLLDYLELMEKWSRAMRLTGLRDPNAWLETHLLDSLSVLRVLGDPEEIVDVGSGGGLPGIPLLLARPTWRGAVVEKHTRRWIFLRQAAEALGLSERVDARQGDAEKERDPRFSAAMTRATWPVERWVPIGARWLGRRGRVIAMLGRDVPATEALEQLGEHAGLELEILDRFELPFSGAARALAVWRR